MKKLISASCIVKNEAHCVLHMMKSIKDLVDCYAIVDTGSTDSTIETIEKFCQENNKELLLERVDFSDFSTCRNLALNLASSIADYSIWIDADEILRYDGSDLESLREMIQEENPSSINIMCSYDFSKSFYWRKNIIRHENEWKWVGKVHEYLKSDSDIKSVYIEGCHIELTPKGASHSKTPEEKFGRYCELLEADWNETQDPRWLFYWAQSESDRKNFEKSWQLYLERCKYEGFFEERYVACLRASRILKALKNPMWIEISLKCGEFDAEKIEHYYDLAFYFYLQSCFKTSEIFIQKALSILRIYNATTSRVLFVENSIYQYQMYDLAFTVSHKTRNFELFQESKLNLQKNLKTISNAKDLDRISKNLLISF